MHRKGLLITCGILWLLLGIYLTSFGAYLLAGALESTAEFKMWQTPILELLSHTLQISFEDAALLIVCGCLVTGSLKAAFVLSKTVKKTTDRILALPSPSPIHRIYDKKYYLLILVMISLGFFMKKSGVPADFRAACYLSIGFAMANASKQFFKSASATLPDSYGR